MPSCDFHRNRGFSFATIKVRPYSGFSTNWKGRARKRPRYQPSEDVACRCALHAPCGYTQCHPLRHRGCGWARLHVENSWQRQPNAPTPWDRHVVASRNFQWSTADPCIPLRRASATCCTQRGTASAGAWSMTSAGSRGIRQSLKSVDIARGQRSCCDFLSTLLFAPVSARALWRVGYTRPHAQRQDAVQPFSTSDGQVQGQARVGQSQHMQAAWRQASRAT